MLDPLGAWEMDTVQKPQSFAKGRRRASAERLDTLQHDACAAK